MLYLIINLISEVIAMDKELKIQIGKRVREKREAAGYTREKLGELCNLSPRFIANVEFGDSTFSIETLTKVCNLLSCSTDYILLGRQSCPNYWLDTTERISALDPKYKEELDRILQAFIEAVNKK